MSWSLESSENGIFLLINGLRAKDLNGTELGSIEQAKPGRNATEIWVSKKYIEQLQKKHSLQEPKYSMWELS